MVDTNQTGCIHHPNMQAINRCKQCTVPTCHKCTVVGPTGKFCSENCKNIHEAFIRRSQELNTRASSTFFVKLRSRVATLLFIVVVMFAAGVVGTVFYIPVLSELTVRVRGLIGI
jgi:hypothetical protein